ncbi:hypothetical protein ED733_000493 [Metarhizium rileyi]|uniref:Protein kinase domain-containing protein n=1 Tax=Metarhizium rileyi (strain RCEF 4871) TaxID=1649241 RepID=A0A5C6G823_METRR|nr:hypothetical protein ED733_000493 [Metarhizium rileyi]
MASGPRKRAKILKSLDYLASAAPDSYISSATLSSLRKKGRPGRRNHILHEQNIFALLQCQPLSPYIIRHFHDANDAIFVDLVADGDLGTVLNNKQVKDTSTQRVTQVKKLQSALDYTRWIRQLATAAARLEQLGLAHCDIRPANMPLSEARNIKLFDFDHACKIRSALASLTEPFARLLGDDGGLDRGTYGIAGEPHDKESTQNPFLEEKHVVGVIHVLSEAIELIQKLPFALQLFRCYERWCSSVGFKRFHFEDLEDKRLQYGSTGDRQQWQYIWLAESCVAKELQEPVLVGILKSDNHELSNDDTLARRAN